MLKAYQAHVAERSAVQLPPLPLSAEQVAQVVELLKAPPAGEAETLLDLISNRTPAGVDQAAYVKAAFLADIAKGEAKSPVISPEKAVAVIRYHARVVTTCRPWWLCLKRQWRSMAVKALSSTILMFDAFHDVDVLMKAGNVHAKKLIESLGECGMVYQCASAC